MSKSRLSHKFSLRELTGQISEEACINVIRSTYHEFGCNTLNALLNKMIMHFTDHTTTDSLIKIEHMINDMIQNSTNKSTTVDLNKNKNKTGTEKSQYKNNNPSLSLLRLPIDLLFKTSLYLNEQDIYNFETCCHLFYKMVNNSSYVNQSNTFKTFIIDADHLELMTQAKCSFYKYSKATSLILSDLDHDETMTIEQVEANFKQAQIVGNYDKWLTTMYKSIKLLEIGCDGTTVLPKLPIDTMFDPVESKLEEIHVYGDNDNTYQFLQKYLSLKKEFENQGKKIRVLKRLLPHYSGGDILCFDEWFYIEAKHVEFDSSPVVVNLNEWDDNFNQSLRIVTFDGCCDFVDHGTSNSENVKCNLLRIETLRFLSMYLVNTFDLLDNGMLIESLNLHNSVKNLTLEFAFWNEITTDHQRRCAKHVIGLLTKKQYFNLENINILLYRKVDTMQPDEFKLVDWMFGILKKHSNILKHQFKQLNIGLWIQQTKDSGASFKRSNILEWNSNINGKILNDYQEKWNQSEQSKLEYDANTKKYQQLMEQWID